MRSTTDSPTLKKKYTKLAWVLGDQLNYQHSWLATPDPETLFVIAELRQETDYTRHHVQKVCAFFAAMRAFAKHINSQGHAVLYLDLDDSSGFANLESAIAKLSARFKVKEFHYQRPDELRLLNEMRNLKLPGSIDIVEFDTEHFLLPFEELPAYVNPKKHNRLESFYRKMRKRFNILMSGDKPAGDQWNFDSENRNKLKKADIPEIPEPLVFSNDVKDILAILKKHKVDTFGVAHEKLLWPVSRAQSLELLQWFCREALPNFGKFQDSMTYQGESKWSLYHSRLSFALNSKMLSPLEVIEAATAKFQEGDSTINLAQIEGFVRQILGWREFVRGIYWVNGDHYKTLNHFQAKRNLPDFFWTGDTKMKCMQEAIDQSLETSYAHHIQRLMITGNFCLVSGIDPDLVDSWYLGIYIDAIEWVELPNTRGMSQFADGGYIATKPYAASGNYINKMSDYCGQCHYKVKLKSGADACPFNSLYWKFMIENRQQLSSNPRISMLYGNWDRKDKGERDAIIESARIHLENLDQL
ncbi:MAG: deoxyribodipyrimidine photolyase-related protein [Pseudohongiellaceae bacterium]|jgi:deoxyribodipyrimidine photolyase-related protein